MATKDSQQSPSSQPFDLEMKGDDDVVQPENQPISDAPPQPEQPINDEEPKEKKEKKMYPCRYCNKTFSSSMALGGHQNGHKRERAMAKKQAKTPVSYHPYPTNYATSYDARYPNYTGVVLNNNFSQGMSGDSMTYNNPSYMSMESPTSSTNTWRLLAEFYAKMGTKPHPTPSAPPAPTSTMLVGVRDFFGESSASKSTGNIGATGIANVINLEDEEEELNLDLKL